MINLLDEIDCPSPLQLIDKVQIHSNLVRVWCKRDDLLHPIISGNKWRKLRLSLEFAVENNTKTILSFGGAYSNHLHALGYCCHKLGVHLVAIIRGERPTHLSPTLTELLNWGTELQFVSRSEYKLRTDSSQLANYQSRFQPDLIIPEGGSNTLAVKAFDTLSNEIRTSGIKFDALVLPVASGATMAGMITHSQDIFSHIYGIAVLKGKDYLESLVQSLLEPNIDAKNTNWSIRHDFHFGGYAKTSESLEQFIKSFKNRTNVPIEPVYSGKCAFGAYQILREAPRLIHHNILFLHTGGLQGARKIIK